jgi:hypothetical protein
MLNDTVRLEQGVRLSVVKAISGFGGSSDELSPRYDIRSRPWLRENAEAKKTVRILFLAPKNPTHKQRRNFLFRFALFLRKCGFHSEQSSYEIHTGLIEEKDSSDFSSVHVFTQPGPKAEMQVSIGQFFAKIGRPRETIVEV